MSTLLKFTCHPATLETEKDLQTWNLPLFLDGTLEAKINLIESKQVVTFDIKQDEEVYGVLNQFLIFLDRSKIFPTNLVFKLIDKSADYTLAYALTSLAMDPKQTGPQALTFGYNSLPGSTLPQLYNEAFYRGFGVKLILPEHEVFVHIDGDEFKCVKYQKLAF